MLRLVAIIIYLASIIAVLVAGGLVASMLSLYSPAHLSSFGPVVPAISQAHAAWLPAAQAISWASAAASVAAAFVNWCSRRSSEVKTQVALAVASINFFVALLLTTTLLVAYFYLPKIANVA